MGFGYHSDFHQPYYLGAGVSNFANAKLLEFALGGHGYRINWDAEIPLRFQSVPTLKQQQDLSDAPGEQSVNPEGLWRRIGESYHLGAGQVHYDRKDSQQFRFRDSQGVDVWEKWQLSLLHETLQKSSSANTNLRAVVAGSHLYWCDGTSIRFLTDLGAGITDITGEPGTPPSSIISDGFNVWTSHGASGIFKTTRGAASTASHITGSTGILGYVRNRVLVTSLDGRSIYDVTALAVGGAPGALPAALFTHGNTDFDFVGFAECAGYIYAAGFSGDKSLIYKIAVRPDGTGLDQPSVAGELPDGEVVTHINGYLGRFVFVGTNKGWRFGVVGGNGDLQLGAFVGTPNSVLCSEGQEEFIWYGLSAFTASETGLGRLSTSKFSDVDNLVPAYASDLMATGFTNDILSVVTFQDKRVFTVSGRGLYYEGTNCVAEGYLDTGKISYGMTEPKIGLWVVIQHEMDTGSFEVLISADGGSFVSLGTHLAEDTPGPFGVGELLGGSFELRIKLNRDTVDLSECPIFLSWLLRVQPRPEVTELIYATVFIAPEIETMVDTPHAYNTDAEIDYIRRLQREKTVTTAQTGQSLYTVILDDYDIIPHSLMEGLSGLDGSNLDCMLKLKVAT
jgi:hypothetical protein